MEFSDGSELTPHDEHLVDTFAPDDWFDEEDPDEINYVYDFGNNWDHKIKFEKTITAEGSDDIPLDEALKGKGASPLEDCGGIHGFMALLRGESRQLCASVFEVAPTLRFYV